jgi:hypothetical protein
LFNNVSEWTETRGCIAFRFKPDLCFLEGGHVASTPDNYDFTRYDCVDRSVRDRLVGFRCAKSVRPFQTP